jgi:hypothetical protein
VSNFAGLGPGFLLRCRSRILRAGVAKKPDVVGLFDLRGRNKAGECAPSRLQRNLFPDDRVLHLTKVQPRQIDEP